MYVLPVRVLRLFKFFMFFISLFRCCFLHVSLFLLLILDFYSLSYCVCVNIHICGCEKLISCCDLFVLLTLFCRFLSFCFGYICMYVCVDGIYCLIVERYWISIAWIPLQSFIFSSFVSTSILSYFVLYVFFFHLVFFLCVGVRAWEENDVDDVQWVGLFFFCHIFFFSFVITAFIVNMWWTWVSERCVLFFPLFL